MNKKNNISTIILLAVIFVLVLAVGGLAIYIATDKAASVKENKSNRDTVEAAKGDETEHKTDSENEADSENVSDAETITDNATDTLSDDQSAYSELLLEWEDKDLVISTTENAGLYCLLNSIIQYDILWTCPDVTSVLTPGSVGGWEDIFKLVPIGDRSSMIGDYFKVKVENNISEALDYYYYNLESLEKLAYCVTGNHMKLSSLEEAKDYLVGGNSNLEDYVKIDNDNGFIIVTVGYTGYYGPFLFGTHTVNNGDGSWSIKGLIVDNPDGYVDVGVIYATVELDASGLDDKFIVKDVRWDADSEKLAKQDWRFCHLMAMEESVYDDSFEGIRTGYDLICFDDDDIPELVINRMGYQVEIWIFEEGSGTKQIWSGGYGAFGINSFFCAPRSSIISWTDINYAGLEWWSCAMQMDSNNEFHDVFDKSVVSRSYKDTNNNECYDEGEPISDNEIYYYLDNVEVSKQEFDEYYSGFLKSYDDIDLTCMGVDYYEFYPKLWEY